MSTTGMVSYTCKTEQPTFYAAPVLMTVVTLRNSRTWIAYCRRISSPEVLRVNGYFTFCSFNSSLHALKSVPLLVSLLSKIMLIPCKANFISARTDRWAACCSQSQPNPYQCEQSLIRLTNALSFPVTQSSNLSPNKIYAVKSLDEIPYSRSSISIFIICLPLH